MKNEFAQDISNPVKTTEPEIKQETQEQVKSVEPVKIEPVAQPTVLVSHTDAYIHERMKAQPKTLADVEVQVVPQETPNKHRLSLPDELNPYLDRFAFKWIFKHKRAIDEACDIKGWVLVNRTHFSDLPAYLFTVNGSMERGDDILAFMPKARAEALRKRPGDESASRIRAQFDKHKDNPKYYVPKDEDDENVIGI